MLLGTEDIKPPPGGVISEAHLLSVGPNSASTRKLLLTNVDNDIELRLVGQNETRFELLSMPPSLDTRDTAITIKAPVKADGNLQIIFNKRAVQGYSLSDGKQAQPVLIVDRKLSSIAQVKESTLLTGKSTHSARPHKTFTLAR
jgi:hypothetical protein